MSATIKIIRTARPRPPFVTLMSATPPYRISDIVVPAGWLIFNAPRPLTCDVLELTITPEPSGRRDRYWLQWEGEWLSGVHYSAINPDSIEFAFHVHELANNVGAYVEWGVTEATMLDEEAVRIASEGYSMELLVEAIGAERAKKEAVEHWYSEFSRRELPIDEFIKYIRKEDHGSESI